MNITLDMRTNHMGYAGVDRLRETISRLGPDDELTIVVDGSDAHVTDRLVEELRHYGFDYQPKGSSDRTTYTINAKRHLLH